MYSYQYFNLALLSDIEFPGLPGCEDDPGEADRGRVRISLSGDAPPGSESHDWFWVGDGDAPAYARTDRGYLLRYAGVADFEVLQRSRSVVVANQRAGLDSVRHTLLHQIIPRSLGQDGHLALHASAVEIDGQEGIIFAGPSGAGKSTLAQSFEGGADRAFADDCVLVSGDIGETSAIPAVSLRGAACDLEPAGGSAQRQDTIPIGAVLFVNDAAIPSADTRPWIKPMDAAEGAMAMIRRRFSIDNEDMVRRSIGAELGLEIE